MLEPLANGRYRAGLRWLGLFPIRPDALGEREIGVLRHRGLEVAYTDRGGRRLPLARRIRPPLAPDAWRARSGRYEVADLGGNYPLIHALELYADDAGVLRFDAYPAKRPFPFPPTCTPPATTTPSCSRCPAATPAARPDGSLRFGGHVLRPVD